MSWFAKKTCPSRGWSSPADRLERGRLSSAVRTDQGDDLVAVDNKIDALKGVDVAVVGVDAAELEQRIGRFARRHR